MHDSLLLSQPPEPLEIASLIWDFSTRSHIGLLYEDHSGHLKSISFIMSFKQLFHTPSPPPVPPQQKNSDYIIFGYMLNNLELKSCTQF